MLHAKFDLLWLQRSPGRVVITLWSFLPKKYKNHKKLFFFVNKIIIFCFICYDKTKFVKNGLFFSSIKIFKLKTV